jgi:hypothetical protein
MNRRWRRHQAASRTHDRARPLAAQLGQPREAAAKLARQRGVRVIVETLVGPEAVELGWDDLRLCPPAAQFDDPCKVDLPGRQRLGQKISRLN